MQKSSIWINVLVCLPNGDVSSHCSLILIFITFYFISFHMISHKQKAPKVFQDIKGKPGSPWKSLVVALADSCVNKVLIGRPQTERRKKTPLLSYSNSFIALSSRLVLRPRYRTQLEFLESGDTVRMTFLGGPHGLRRRRVRNLGLR